MPAGGQNVALQLGGKRPGRDLARVVLGGGSLKSAGCLVEKLLRRGANFGPRLEIRYGASAAQQDRCTSHDGQQNAERDWSVRRIERSGKKKRGDRSAEQPAKMSGHVDALDAHAESHVH